MTTVYFAGGEDNEFSQIAGGSVTTTAGRFRSTHARCALAVTSNSVTGAINTQNTCRWRPLNGFAATEFWASARCRQGSDLRINLNSIVKFIDPDGTPRLQLRTEADGSYVMEKLDDTGTATQIGLKSFFDFSSISIDKLDFHILYDVVGSIDIYLNGIYVFAFTGDCTTDGVTQLGNIDLMTPVGVGSSTYWSEVFVTDIDTRSLSLPGFDPVANGNTNTFDTGSPSVGNVNEIVLDDATLNGSSAAGQKDQYTVGAVPSGTLDVIAVVISARAQRGPSGPSKIALGVRTNGADYWGSDQLLDVAWENVREVFFTNPDTGVPWLKSEIGAAVGFNIGSKSAA